MEKRHPQFNGNQSLIYQIKVAGQIDQKWTDWFGCLAIWQVESGDTLITVSAVDQASLHGLLRKIRDLGLVLISVNPLNADDPSDSSINKD